MSDLRNQEARPLTLREAVNDLGWLPIALMGLGGLSIIDILEKAIIQRDLNLAAPFEIVLRGYQRITALLAATVEPILQPAVSWMGDMLHWRLVLQPYWRSFFVVGLIVAMGFVRTQGGDVNTLRWSHITTGITIAVGALLSAVAIGILPLSGAWWAQGLAAATPAAFIMAFMGVGIAGDDVLRRGWVQAREDLFEFAQAGAALGLLAFVLGAGLSLVPGIEGAGVLAFGLIVALLGVGTLIGGLFVHETALTRFGLTSLGGFLAGALILIANAAIKALS
jgi:hypothetical protein